MNFNQGEQPSSASVSGQNKSKILQALPKKIIDKTIEDGKVNFSLFKATLAKGKVKFIPHGNLRTPYLINNTMLSPCIYEEIAFDLGLPVDEVKMVLQSIALEAQEALKAGVGASYLIEGLCRVYLDCGKIRVSMTK